jgi:hypothetical protein
MILPLWNNFFHIKFPSIKSPVEFMRGGGEGKGKGFFKLTLHA